MGYRVSRTQDQLPTPKGCPRPALHSATVLAIPQHSQATGVAGGPAPWGVAERPVLLTSSAHCSRHLPPAASLELALQEPLANT